MQVKITTESSRHFEQLSRVAKNIGARHLTSTADGRIHIFEVPSVEDGVLLGKFIFVREVDFIKFT